MVSCTLLPLSSGTCWRGSWVGLRASLDTEEEKNLYPCWELNNFRICIVNIVTRIVWRLYKTGWIDNWIYWITQLHTITVYTLLQLLTVHYHTCRVFTLYFTGCLSSNIAGSFRLQLCNSSLKTAARPEYSLVTRELVTAGLVTVELSA
jgi:hypothetical protein